jgi:Uma2 family endonuclease
MSTVSPRRTPPGDAPLVAGQRLTQAEFHRRYELCPPGQKWELVGGIVYMTSPLRYPHGRCDQVLSYVLGVYENATPGVEVTGNTTTILGEESEPQPDLLVRIVEECGGQSRINERSYLEGAPELVAEISHSSRVLDLKHKRRDYQRSGVVEYLVVDIEDEELYWFHFPSGQEIRPNRRGVLQSRVLPGLWIHAEALLALDSPRIQAVAEKGLASRAHAAFVKRLQAERRRRSPK